EAENTTMDLPSRHYPYEENKSVLNNPKSSIAQMKLKGMRELRRLPVSVRSILTKIGSPSNPWPVVEVFAVSTHVPSPSRPTSPIDHIKERVEQTLPTPNRAPNRRDFAGKNLSNLSLPLVAIPILTRISSP
ncbi:hypothetical protein Dimus_018629, partial [Dionaea muscipula]